MLAPVTPNPSEVKSLEGVIGWFNQNSAELIEEYRRLERRVRSLKTQLAEKNRELELSLREREASHRYLRSVLESLNGAVIAFDAELEPTFANGRAAEWLGAVDGQSAAKLLGNALAQALRRGEKSFLPLECEAVLAAPAGAATPVHVTVTEVTFADGRAHFVFVLHDIAALKRLEAEAARSSRLASLGAMAAEVAHQVKSPLGAIELYASLLKEKAMGEPKQLADEILGGVRRLSANVNNLLAFAAEPTITAEVLPVPLVMKDLLQECLTLFDQPECSVVFDIAAELPPLWGDRSLLVQALLNIIVNAKEAMAPAGGRVMVRVRFAPFSALRKRIHRAVEICIADQGCGIAAADRERIFDPLFTTKKQGSGLGLALSQRIIDAHDGAIEVDSQPGAGTRFTVYLPAAEEC